VAIGIGSSLFGLTIAFYANVAAGGAIVLTSVGILVLTMGTEYVVGKVRA
jgi:ABC-type Mn2+/Zn2+ transport system permease subunit